MPTFGARLGESITERGPLCVGIDPHPALLSRWGLSDDPAGLKRFCAAVVEAAADLVAVVKPQSAFFERFGSAGISILESTIRQLRDRGILVVLDVKRGDIGSTAQAYAQAYLDPASPLAVDAITVNPYLGFGSIAPILDEAMAHDNGVFVLALTSNPEGAQVQRAVTASGRTVAQVMLDEVARRNLGARPMGSVGVVIGATVGANPSSASSRGGGSAPAARRGVADVAAPSEPVGGVAEGSVDSGTGLDLSQLNGPVLAPGLGAQGGRLEDLNAVFAGLTGVVIPAYSREILAHGPSVPGLRAAITRTAAECRNVLNYPFL